MQSSKLIGLFINFYDSFSENIVDEFNKQMIVLKKIDWDDKYLSREISNQKYSFIVLGPGPGHVDDYKNISTVIKEALYLKKKIIGFCLGHQLLAKTLGLELIQLDKPLHGKSFQIQFTSEFFGKNTIQKVQFYNSWYVSNTAPSNVDSLVNVINEKSMVCALRAHGVLSYQFHPESVGTTCPSEFFSFIKEFLYNKDDVDEEDKI